MTASSTSISYQNRDLFYRELKSEISGLLDSIWFTTLSNSAATLAQHLPDVNWVGFYLMEGVLDAPLEKRQLVLGPFHGKPACVRIAIGKGVCGTAVERRSSMLVEDVETFPGHIACDAASRSELVIPMIKDSHVIGVLDLDSPRLARFDEVDRQGLEAIVRIIVEGTPWPARFI